jgi:hypothetical protein
MVSNREDDIASLRPRLDLDRPVLIMFFVSMGDDVRTRFGNDDSNPRDRLLVGTELLGLLGHRSANRRQFARPGPY